jgi:hypothetical protein
MLRKVLIAAHSLRRHVGMELEGQPHSLGEAFGNQPVDSDRVDVAPGSDVIRIDEQLDGDRETPYEA